MKTFDISVSDYCVVLLFCVMLGFMRVTKSIDKGRYAQRFLDLGVVKVTYYTALKSMTDDSPTISAWGDEVYEGCLAVSPDLLTKVWHNDCVFLFIDGKKTAFIVDDKMRPRKKIRLMYLLNASFTKQLKIKKIFTIWKKTKYGLQKTTGRN